MNLPFPPLPPDEPEISLPAFLKRLDAEPDFARKMQAHYESHLQEHHPENVRAAARQALLTLKHRRGLVGAHNRQMAMMELLGGDANKELSAETVPACAPGGRRRWISRWTYWSPNGRSA